LYCLHISGEHQLSEILARPSLLFRWIFALSELKPHHKERTTSVTKSYKHLQRQRKKERRINQERGIQLSYIFVYFFLLILLYLSGELNLILPFWCLLLYHLFSKTSLHLYSAPGPPSESEVPSIAAERAIHLCQTAVSFSHSILSRSQPPILPLHITLFFFLLSHSILPQDSPSFYSKQVEKIEKREK
jgi:hypothetical protein